ncbi:MAG TPA: glycoside hydrolase family 3 N-terminal domain-containing protein, partial [Longimicrobiales bacterium]|nr:glycoside hydrolase family 3 N-terminal domain-containing protein [Longimicrobiales bacterium]
PYSPAVPALRWSQGEGYGLDAPRVRAALEEGSAGFILFGGTADAAREAARELIGRAGRPLLLGADLERGAGQQFHGATPLPPLAALGALGDPGVIRQAAALTAREACALGVPWIFAPVADLAVEPDNPIVATRALGADPPTVGEQVAAWVEGCMSAGGIPCVKHFPGHGRTREDSHAALPVVDASRELLESTDLVPFRRGIQAGAPSVMTAHVAYPALDPSGLPATRSRAILTGLLRGRMGFGGVVVTDALIMEGAGRGQAALEEALAAGVDLLLYPPEDAAVGEAVGRALEAGRLDPADWAASRARVEAVAAGLPAAQGGWGAEADRLQARAWASRVLVPPRDRLTPGVSVDLTVVDDDLGGPYPPPSRETFPLVLRRGGLLESGDGPALPVLAVFGEPRAWKGRAGLSARARDRAAAWAASLPAGPRGAGGLVVIFGGPRVSADAPGGVPTLLAWGGEPLMQEAAAGWLVAALRSGTS